jgi:predicted RNA-binding protein (virulence factor B family)
MEALKIGELNTLKVIKSLDFGIYLDGLNEGEILMPRQYIPEGTVPGDMIECFIYFDSEDRIIATTLVPYAKVGEFAYLEVSSVNPTGAFLNWGLPKDLLVPFREQKAEMGQGRKYVVYIYFDELSKRIAATAKIEQYLNLEPLDYEVGQAVTLLIYQKTDIGFKAIINQKHMGVVHNSDLFMSIDIGTEMIGYIKQVKIDGKVDLLLQKPGYEVIDELAQFLLDKLKMKNGFLALTDKSPSELIYHQLAMSKKSFKKAVGSLYKNRLITLEEDGIKLV